MAKANVISQLSKQCRHLRLRKSSVLSNLSRSTSDSILYNYSSILYNHNPKQKMSTITCKTTKRQKMSDDTLKKYSSDSSLILNSPLHNTKSKSTKAIDIKALKNANAKKKKKEKKKKLAPNYFVSLRITSDEIKRKAEEIQDLLFEEYPTIKRMKISVNLMHITLLVCRLEGNDIERAKLSMSSVLENMSLGPELFTIGVSGMGTFGKRVLFADVTVGRDSVIELANALRDNFKKDNLVVTDSRELNPHITLAKSRDGRIRMPDECVEKHTSPHVHFGTQTVRTLELCKMKRSDDGYYVVDEELDLASGKSVLASRESSEPQEVPLQTADTGDNS